MKVQRAIVVTDNGCWRHTLKFYVKVFLLWARQCQASYPVWGQILLMVVLILNLNKLIYCLKVWKKKIGSQPKVTQLALTPSWQHTDVDRT